MADNWMDYMSEAEKKEYENYQKKAKAQRDKAVARQKAEQSFWKKVRERKDEVLEFIGDDSSVDIKKKVDEVCELYGCTCDELFEYIKTDRQVNYYRQYHQ